MEIKWIFMEFQRGACSEVTQVENQTLKSKKMKNKEKSGKYRQMNKIMKKMKKMEKIIQTDRKNRPC